MVLRNSGLIVNITRWVVIVKARDYSKDFDAANLNKKLSLKSDEELHISQELEQTLLKIRSNNVMICILAI